MSNHISPVQKLLTYFSFPKLRRSVAWLLRVKKLLKARVKCRRGGKEFSLKRSCLGVDDLDIASVEIVKLVQGSEFEREFRCSAEASHIVAQASSCD